MFRNTAKKRLSKGILDMKFMQRSKEKAKKELIDEEGRALFSCLVTDEMKSGIGNCVIEHSYMRCEDLIEGRMSFQGMNPEVERFLELQAQGKNPSIVNSNEVDITDQEMAEAYKSSLVKTMASRFSKKKPNKREQKMKWENADITPPPSKKKKNFLKPKDE